MSKMDRLATLMERFTLQVTPASLEAATMVVTAGESGTSGHVWFGHAGVGSDFPAGTVLFSAEVDWGGVSKPLLAALPEDRKSTRLNSSH